VSGTTLTARAMSCWSPVVISIDMSLRIQHVILSDMFTKGLTCPTLRNLGDDRD
jgi:hypothetical protein